MKSVYIIGIVLLLCSSCTGSQESYSRYADFPEIKNLVQLKEREADSVYLRYPYRIEIKDSLAVLLDLHPEDYFFHVFTYPDWQLVASFGKRGEGPEEILSAERVRICSSDSVWVLDSNRRQLTRWQICPSERCVKRVEEIALDSRLVRTLDFSKTETGFLVTDYTGDFRYHVLDSHGQIRNSIGSIPTERSVSGGERGALAQAWRSFMDYNPHNGVMAMVTQLGEVVEVMNLKTGEHQVCYGPGGEPKFQVSKGYGIPVGIMGFVDVQVTDRAIYAIYQGVSFQQIAQSIQQEKFLPGGGRYLYVFTLTGAPLLCYQLDHYVSGIHVDEQSSAMIAVDANRDRPVVEFHLGE